MTRPEALRREAGFTLVELMISVALLGMLTTALFSGVSFGTRVWRKAEQISSDLSKVRAAQILIQNSLSRIYPLIVREEGHSGRAEFDGGINSLTFLTDARDVAPGGLARTTIQVERDSVDTVLTYIARPELALAGTGARKLLLRGVKTFELSYFGADDINTPGRWSSTWRNKVRLPTLIRVRLALNGVNAPIWPDLLVRPRLTADSGCVLDALTKSCRGY